MTAYLMANIEVLDPAQFEEYRAAVPASIAAFGGRYLIRGGPVQVLEGSWHPKRFVMLEFPDAERARAWWASAEYAAAKAIRLSCANSELVIVAGI